MQDALAQLRDIHLPPAIGWWPPAPGWWLLGLLLIAALTALWRIWLRRQRRQRYRILALAELRQLQQEADSGQTAQQCCDAYAALLKRVALSVYPAEAVAQLHGSAWGEFLQQQCLVKATPEVLAALGEARYAPGFSADLDAVYEYCEQWIRSHRAGQEP